MNGARGHRWRLGHGMTRLFMSGLVLTLVTGCGMVERVWPRPSPAPDAPVVVPEVPQESAQAPVLAPETTAPPPAAAARTVEALDTTTPEQRAAAVAPPQEPETSVGTTIVSLGSPTEPGLWLKTPLVKEETQGRVRNPANGKSSLVTLLPLEGPQTAGSRMSLAAMRLIELSLTDLSEVEVTIDG